MQFVQFYYNCNLLLTMIQSIMVR